MAEIGEPKRVITVPDRTPVRVPPVPAPTRPDPAPARPEPVPA